MLMWMRMRREKSESEMRIGVSRKEIRIIMNKIDQEVNKNNIR